MAGTGLGRVWPRSSPRRRQPPLSVCPCCCSRVRGRGRRWLKLGLGLLLGTEEEALQSLSVRGLGEDLGGADLPNMSVPPTQTAVMRSWWGPCTIAPWVPPPTMGSSRLRASPDCTVSLAPGSGEGLWGAGSAGGASGESPCPLSRHKWMVPPDW